LGADLWNSYPNGFPEDETDSKSESFGGLVFAMYFPPQCIINTEINSQHSRKGLMPTRNTFSTFVHFLSFKNLQNSFSQLFRQQMQRPCSDKKVFCILTRHDGFHAVQR
jgi:hypothetical protein